MFAPPVAKQKTKSGEFSRAPVVQQRHHQPALSQVQLLQRRIGNQALLRLFSQHGSEPGAPGNMARLPGILHAKLRIGAVNDPLEHEADRVADQVMRMPAPASVLSSAPEQVSCKCAECEEEEEKLQMKEAGPEAATGEAPASVHEVLRSPGQPLDAATRGFMEPRFGQDFSGVRVHSDAAAAQSARDVNAHAYTMGHNIVFDAARFAPGTHDGQRLIAHELTHVVQQDFQVRRMTLGSGKGPDELREVPDKERGRVLAAIARVRKVAKDSKGYANCHKTYAETCPGGSASSLENAFDTAVLWRIPPGQQLGAGASTLCGSGNVGYTDTGFDGGEASLAFDLLHELGHVCGISCPDTPHYLADKLALYCVGPQERDQARQLTFRFGLSTEDWALILSYGWLLHEWRAGRLGLRLNADLNVIGALQGLKDAMGEEAPAGEIGGATIELRARPFSGEHFGGLSFHVGLGGQFGRFLVRPPTTSDPDDIRSDAALVVELGSRIEWWVKHDPSFSTEGEAGRVKPRALDFSYRAIQPATTEARRAHEFLASYILHF